MDDVGAPIPDVSNDSPGLNDPPSVRSGKHGIQTPIRRMLSPFIGQYRDFGALHACQGFGEIERIIAYAAMHRREGTGKEKDFHPALRRASHEKV
jgi:hypothetical protein